MPSKNAPTEIVDKLTGFAALAARHALPVIFPNREHALAGGLMSYGINLDYFGHQIGILTRRILKGARPADLPVEQAVKSS
jgi:putative ABC transport system substrate-binding protein